MRLPKREELINKDEKYLFKKDTDGFESFSSAERINKIIQLVKGNDSGGKILDMGSAQGNIATLLAEEGFDTTALDLNKNFLNYAKKKYEFGKITYVCGNALSLPFKKNSFDTIIIGELIEHVAYPDRLIKKSKSYLKKGGLMIFTTPNNHIFSGLLSGHKLPLFKDLGKKERGKLINKQFGPSGSDHLFVFDMPSLEELVKNQGLQVIDSGMLNPFFINHITFNFFKLFPKPLLSLINGAVTKVPFIRDKFSMGLYLVAKNE